jgi:hypothetical protein
METTIRADKTEVLDRLRELADANGGRLKPQDVVDDARDEASPLHAYFTWDVEKAAAERWLDQARTLIRSVEVTFRTDITVVRAPYFVRDPAAGPKVPGYVAVKALRTESDLAREAIVNEFSRVADLMRRAQNLAKALQLEEEVGALVSQVVELRDRVAASAEQSS